MGHLESGAFKGKWKKICRIIGSKMLKKMLGRQRNGRTYDPVHSIGCMKYVWNHQYTLRLVGR